MAAAITAGRNVEMSFVAEAKRKRLRSDACRRWSNVDRSLSEISAKFGSPGMRFVLAARSHSSLSLCNSIIDISSSVRSFLVSILRFLVSILTLRRV